MQLFMLFDGLDLCVLLVDCDVLSAVWTAPIHCKGSIGEQDVMLNFSKSVLMKK